MGVAQQLSYEALQAPTQKEISEKLTSLSPPSPLCLEEQWTLMRKRHLERENREQQPVPGRAAVSTEGRGKGRELRGSQRTGRAQITHDALS